MTNCSICEKDNKDKPKEGIHELGYGPVLCDEHLAEFNRWKESKLFGEWVASRFPTPNYYISFMPHTCSCETKTTVVCPLHTTTRYFWTTI